MTQQPDDWLLFSQDSHPSLADSGEAHDVIASFLPPELSRPIISLVYNPWLTARRDEVRDYRAVASTPESNDDYSIAALFLSTGPIPTDPQNLKKAIPQRIIFQTRSADQGWATFGGDGTFENSHTWFEASILRPWGPNHQQDAGDVPLEETLASISSWDPAEARDHLRTQGWDFVEGEDERITWRVCNNVTAQSEFQNYEVEWRRNLATEVEDENAIGDGEGFLELLGPGCIVALWARAEQRYWVNKVQAATIEIEYEFF
ncbi:ubiquitin-protein ligase [Fusarium austroafricanum]|uniref:Ubiquitin-protein ligase n=1 Tax=Fusarium austroafricanum TaxID=2364996 RepID=A0A8H4KG83_9HYPO|nr:ubiquitin-protein ligase [Fusarium austroafricanum]